MRAGISSDVARQVEYWFSQIIVFALSPRFTLEPAALLVVGGLSALIRWLIAAQEPPVAVLALAQLAHGLSFGLTQVATMALLMRHVPVHVMAKGQGYLAASSGIVTSSASVLSGAIYARYGHGVYYAMAVMAGIGTTLMWLARLRLRDHPQSAASGG
jgi:PPP family 3-phenylpropionic acid transporter